jgi:DNA-binding SARP family transcriptional activator
MESRTPFSIRVETFGGFRLSVSGVNQVAPSNRIPLLLLRTLIANGGLDVPWRDLCRQMRPSEEPSYARAWFDNTLSRLRRALRQADAVRFVDGRLSIDREGVWVDTWLFTELAGHLLGAASWSARALPYLAHCADTMLAVYRGPFMPEAVNGLFERARACHRAKFVQAIRALTRSAEAFGRSDLSRFWCERACSIDPPLAEILRDSKSWPELRLQLGPQR